MTDKEFQPFVNKFVEINVKGSFLVGWIRELYGAAKLSWGADYELLADNGKSYLFNVEDVSDVWEKSIRKEIVPKGFIEVNGDYFKATEITMIGKCDDEYIKIEMKNQATYFLQKITLNDLMARIKEALNE